MNDLLLKIYASGGFDKGKVFKDITPESKTLSMTDVLNQVYVWAGIICVIVVIVAGIFYVTSTGDTGRITRAKNALIYSLVGLGIIIMAFTITNFVVGAL